MWKDQVVSLHTKIPSGKIMHLSERMLIIGTVNTEEFCKAVTAACKSLIEAEPRITQYDTAVGDGDCGTTLRRGAEAILESASLKTSRNASTAVLHIAHAIEESMDGTSGALYELFFNALAADVRSQLVGVGLMDSKSWAKALAGALGILMKATPARKGDRTLMDALIPFVEAFASTTDFSCALTEARNGRDSTKGMSPSFGRSVYVTAEAWEKVPDPGADGIIAILEGIASAIGV